PDLEAGTIRIMGYSGGPLASGVPAPSEIDCIRVFGNYQCGYGPVANGALGMSPEESPFNAGVQPIAPGDLIRFQAGGGLIAPFDRITMPAGTLAVAEDLRTLAWDPTRDTTLHVSCPDQMGGTCLAVVLTDVLASANSASQINQ